MMPFIHPLYTLYTLFIHFHFHIYTYVNLLCMYTHQTYTEHTSKHPYITTTPLHDRYDALRL